MKHNFLSGIVRQFTWHFSWFVTLLIFTLNFSFFTLSAQTHSDKLVSHNGKKYYLHVVVKGETIYGISKDYNVEVRDIVLQNPRSIDGISPGDTLQLPVFSKQTDTKNWQNVSNADSALYIYHKVEPKETLYSLCRLYGVNATVLDSINPLLKEKGMQTGMTIRIPKSKSPDAKRNGSNGTYRMPYKRDSAKEANAYKNLLLQDQKELINQNNIRGMPLRDSAIRKAVGGHLLERYNVALLLPFMNEEVDSLNMSKLLEGVQQFPLLSQISCDFYEGARFALDSAAKEGVKANLYVFNIPSDSSDNKIDSLLKSKLFDTMNLIIGPPSPINFRQVAAFALKRNIPIVSPLSPESDVIQNNKVVSKTVPSPETEMEQMADYIVSHSQSTHIIIVHNPDAANDKYFETFKKRITAAVSINEPRTDSLYIVNYTDDLKSFGEKLDDKKCNIIIVPYQDASFVTKFLNQLSNSKYADHDSISVFGMQNWCTMDVLDANNLDTLHFHYPTNEFIDYSNPLTVRFFQKFHNQYFTEPNFYTLQGFDILYYYLSMLKKFGTALQDNLTTNPYSGLHTSFYFYRPYPSGGLENKAIIMMEYRNFNRQRDK